MRIRRINLFLIAVGVALMGIACTVPQAAADPTDATSEAEPTIMELDEATATTMVEPTDEDVVVYCTSFDVRLIGGTGATPSP